MKIKTVCSLIVLDKLAQDYDLPIKENGVEVGRNTGTSYKLCVKTDGVLPETISLPKTLVSKFDELVIGQSYNFVFQFETSPKAYVDKNGKGAVNFADVPQIIDVVPFKK